MRGIGLSNRRKRGPVLIHGAQTVENVRMNHTRHEIWKTRSRGVYFNAHSYPRPVVGLQRADPGLHFVPLRGGE